MQSATATSGSVTRKTEPQSKNSSRAPETSGPSAAIPPPSADQSAIDFVRPGPDHSAVISARVVGYAIPAEMPPTTRAANRTVSVGAKPATSDAGTERLIPSTIMSLRP